MTDVRPLSQAKPKGNIIYTDISGNNYLKKNNATICHVVTYNVFEPF